MPVIASVLTVSGPATRPPPLSIAPPPLVTVNVTERPIAAGFTDEPTEIVLPALMTFSVKAFLEG